MTWWDGSSYSIFGETSCLILWRSQVFVVYMRDLSRFSKINKIAIITVPLEVNLLEKIWLIFSFQFRSDKPLNFGKILIFCGIHGWFVKLLKDKSNSYHLSATGGRQFWHNTIDLLVRFSEWQATWLWENFNHMWHIFLICRGAKR